MSAEVPAPRRVVLTAAELAYLLDRTGVDLPPGWAPSPESSPGAGPPALPNGFAESGLVKKKIVTGAGEEAEVHPSIERNLRILASPRVVLDTLVSIGDRGMRSVHVVSGPLGASLFALADGAVELSMFAAVHLGRELVRAVPSETSEREQEIGDALGAENAPRPLRGRLPLSVLQEVGAARLTRVADPGVVAAVLAQLELPAGQARLAGQVADRVDGALRCLITAQLPERVVSSEIIWLHSDDGWTGMRPDPDGSGRRMVRLTPAAREDLGTWAGPVLAGALS